MRYGKVAAPMAGVEELLVFKAMAARPRDVEDAVTLLTLYPHVDLARVRRRVIALAELADAPELTLGFEQILRVASGTPVARTPHPAKAPARSQVTEAPSRKAARTAPRRAIVRTPGAPKKTRKRSPR
jgi:hypothetical protein